MRKGASVAIEHNSDDAALGMEIQKVLLSGHCAGSACWQSRTICMFSSEKAFACCSWQHGTVLDRSSPSNHFFYVKSLDAVTALQAFLDMQW